MAGGTANQDNVSRSIKGRPEFTALFEMIYRKATEAKMKKAAQGHRPRGGAGKLEDEADLCRSILDSASQRVLGGPEAKKDTLAFLEACIRAVSNRQTRVADLPRFSLPESATLADLMKFKEETLGRYKDVRSFDIELLAYVTQPTDLKAYHLVDITRPSANVKDEPISVAQMLVSETDNYFCGVRATPPDPTAPDGFFVFSNIDLPSFFGEVHYMSISSRYSTIGDVGVCSAILGALVEEIQKLTPKNCRKISTYMEELLELGMFLLGEIPRMQPPVDLLLSDIVPFSKPKMLTLEVLFFMRNWSFLSKVIFAFYLAMVEVSLDVSGCKESFLKGRKQMIQAFLKFKKKGYKLDLIGDNGFFTLRYLVGRCLQLLKFDESFVKRLIMRRNRGIRGEIREIRRFSSKQEEPQEKQEEPEDDDKREEKAFDDPKKIEDEWKFWKDNVGPGHKLIKVLLELDIDLSDKDLGIDTSSHQEDVQMAHEIECEDAKYLGIGTSSHQEDAQMAHEIECGDAKYFHISEDVESTSSGGIRSPVNAAACELASEYQSNNLLSTDANRLDPERSTNSSGGKKNNEIQSEDTLAGGCATLIPEEGEYIKEDDYRGGGRGRGQGFVGGNQVGGFQGGMNRGYNGNYNGNRGYNNGDNRGYNNGNCDNIGYSNDNGSGNQVYNGQFQQGKYTANYPNNYYNGERQRYRRDEGQPRKEYRPKSKPASEAASYADQKSEGKVEPAAEAPQKETAENGDPTVLHNVDAAIVNSSYHQGVYNGARGNRGYQERFRGNGGYQECRYSYNGPRGNKGYNGSAGNGGYQGHRDSRNGARANNGYNGGGNGGYQEHRDSNNGGRHNGGFQQGGYLDRREGDYQQGSYNGGKGNGGYQDRWQEGGYNRGRGNWQGGGYQERRQRGYQGGYNGGWGNGGYQKGGGWSEG